MFADVTDADFSTATLTGAAVGGCNLQSAEGVDRSEDEDDDDHDDEW